MSGGWISVWPRANRPGTTQAWCVGVALALLGAGLFVLERHRSDALQERRNREQLEHLQTMTSLQSAAVLEVATAWRLSYPEPSEDRLAELRDLVRQVQADPEALDAPAAAAKAACNAGRRDAQTAWPALATTLPAAAAEQGAVTR